jgi:hypothetical protein
MRFPRTPERHLGLAEAIRNAALGGTLARTQAIGVGYGAPDANSTGSTIEGSSFSGLLTRVEIGHVRIGSEGNGRIRSQEARNIAGSCVCPP